MFSVFGPVTCHLDHSHQKVLDDDRRMSDTLAEFVPKCGVGYRKKIIAVDSVR